MKKAKGYIRKHVSSNNNILKIFSLERRFGRFNTNV